MSELPPIPNSNQHSANVCPLCEKEIQKKSALYGVTVCKKCNRSFVGKRQFAIVIDGLIIYLAISPIYILGLPPLVEIFIVFLWYIVAFPFKDAFNGQSLGKKLFGLKVIDKQNGAPISIKQSIIRNCFWGIPYKGLNANDISFYLNNSEKPNLKIRKIANARNFLITTILVHLLLIY